MYSTAPNIYTCIYTCVYICIYTYICIYMYIYIYVYICISKYLYVCIHVYIEKVKRKKDICLMLCLFPNAFRLHSFFFFFLFFLFSLETRWKINKPSTVYLSFVLPFSTYIVPDSTRFFSLSLSLSHTHI